MDTDQTRKDCYDGAIRKFSNKLDVPRATDYSQRKHENQERFRRNMGWFRRAEEPRTRRDSGPNSVFVALPPQDNSGWNGRNQGKKINRTKTCQPDSKVNTPYQHTCSCCSVDVNFACNSTSRACDSAKPTSVRLSYWWCSMFGGVLHAR